MKEKIGGGEAMILSRGEIPNLERVVDHYGCRFYLRRAGVEEELIDG